MKTVKKRFFVGIAAAAFMTLSLSPAHAMRANTAPVVAADARIKAITTTVLALKLVGDYIAGAFLGTFNAEVEAVRDKVGIPVASCDSKCIKDSQRDADDASHYAALAAVTQGVTFGVDVLALATTLLYPYANFQPGKDFDQLVRKGYLRGFQIAMVATIPQLVALVGSYVAAKRVNRINKEHGTQVAGSAQEALVEATDGGEWASGAAATANIALSMALLAYYGVQKCKGVPENEMFGDARTAYDGNADGPALTVVNRGGKQGDLRLERGLQLTRTATTVVGDGATREEVLEQPVDLGDGSDEHKDKPAE